MEYIWLEEQTLSHGDFFCQAVQDTQWLGLAALGEPKVKAACASAGDGGNVS